MRALVSVGSTCTSAGQIARDGYCFSVALTEKSWDEAREYCLSLGGDLAAPQGPQLYDDIETLFPSNE